MLTFIHTSDWHLGHVYRRLGERAMESFDWRFSAAQRVFDLAREHNADFILVAGDVFDSDTPSTLVVNEAVQFFREAPAPIYLIGGRHDPCAEGSVWFFSTFAEALRDIPHVHLLREHVPVSLDDGKGVLFPCPTLAKEGREDAMAPIPSAPRDDSLFRIAMAHDESKTAQHEIGLDCVERCGLDYLALGGRHEHSVSTPDVVNSHTCYCGAPEVGAGDADDDLRAGYALLVQIESPGAKPRVKPHRVGRVQGCDWGEILLQSGEGTNELQLRFEAIENRSDTLLRAQLTGAVSQSEWRELEERLAHWREELLGVDVDVSLLAVEPSREDFEALHLEAPEARLLALLDGKLEARDLAGVAEREVIANWSRDENARRAARTLLYQLLREDG